MRSSRITPFASQHICYFSNGKNPTICGEHFDPYGMIPLIFFLLKPSIVISQPFDLYSCFCLSIEYWKLFFFLSCLLFFPDLLLFSVSGGSFKLYVSGKEQMWWMPVCPFLPRSCSGALGCRDPTWGSMCFLHSYIQHHAYNAQSPADVSAAICIRWVPTLLFAKILFSFHLSSGD